MKRLTKTGMVFAICAIGGCESTSTPIDTRASTLVGLEHAYLLSSGDHRTSLEKMAVLNKNAEIKRLIALARAATSDGRYEDAIALLDPILKLDPQNDYAIGVRPLLEGLLPGPDGRRPGFQAQRRWEEH